MKLFGLNIIFITLLLTLYSCKNNENGKIVDLINPPIISFDKDTLYFGYIIEGQKKIMNLNYKNIGKNDLHILTINSNCGCTIARNYKTKLKINESDNIEIKLDTKGYKSGKIIKELNIMANTNPSITKFYIEADIITNN